MVFEWTPPVEVVASLPPQPSSRPEILRTFSSVFPTVALYKTPAGDSPSLFAVGSEHPIISDVEAIDRRLESAEVGPTFRAGGIEAGEQLLELRMDLAAIAPNLSSYPVVTDDRPLVDFLLGPMDNYPDGSH